MSNLPSRKRARHTLPSIAAIACALSLVLTGCGADAEDDNAPEAATTRTFTADNGDIEIPTDPERIVATGYAVPVLIEADADLVGISEWSRGVAMMSEEDAATYEELPKVAGEIAAETNYEAIAEADPDLIIIGVPRPARVDLDVTKLEGIAPVVVIGPTHPDSWKTISAKQADAAGASEGFEAARDAYLARAEDVRAAHADTIEGLKFGHLGAYGDVQAGTFHREFAGSWGTNIGDDVGIDYYGEVVKKGGGSEDVSEYPSIEQLPESFADADVITYSLDIDGKVPQAIQYVLDHELWQNLPAVKAGKVLPLRYTEAATYTSALMTLDAIDEALGQLQ